MDYEKEPLKPTPQKTRLKPYPTETFRPASIKRNFVQETCVILGTTIFLIGLIGFVVNDFLRMHLSYIVSLTHVIAGILAMAFGFTTKKAAKRISFILGGFYGAIGIAGLILGSKGMPSIGAIKEDNFLWNLVPGNIEFGATDHTVHLIISITFILGAVLNFKPLKR